jgi:colicin import membrane protein
MSAQSPGSYGISVLIHGAAALLIVFFSYAADSVVQESPKVLELVAGEGDNYAATAAPALGSPDGKLGAIAVPKAAPSPIQSAPPETMVVQSAPKPAAKPAKTTKPTKVPDLATDFKRIEAKREARLEKKYLKEEEAEKKRMTQEEFQKEQAAKAGTKVSHIDAEGIREGVIGGSTSNKTGGAGGKALTREEGNELDAYFAELKAKIKENHVPPEGVSDSLVARVEFFVAADGSVSHVRIAKSSGNDEFDLSVVEACERTHSIGVRPDGRSETVQMAFRVHEDESP